MSDVREDRDWLIEKIADQETRLRRVLLAYSADNPFFSTELTIKQLKVLLLLAFSGSGQGRSSGSELSEMLGVGLATVTGIVDRLASQGLVERRDDSGDRRVRWIFITERGRQMTDRVLDSGLDRRERLLRRLDTRTLRNLEDANEKLLEAAFAEAEQDEVISNPSGKL